MREKTHKVANFITNLPSDLGNVLNVRDILGDPSNDHENQVKLEVRVWRISWANDWGQFYEFVFLDQKMKTSINRPSGQRLNR